MPMIADLLSPIYPSTPGLFVCSLVCLAFIILIEATVLRLLRWASWGIAFLHAFLINLVTSLIGTGLFMFATAEKFADGIPLPVILFGAFLLTVIIEAIELKVLRLSASFSRVTLNSLVANIFSYAFLGGMILALSFPVIGYSGRTGPNRRPTPLSSPTASP